MWQNIIALSIVAIAVGVIIYRIVSPLVRKNSVSVKGGHCGGSCGCGN